MSSAGLTKQAVFRADWTVDNDWTLRNLFEGETEQGILYLTGR